MHFLSPLSLFSHLLTASFNLPSVYYTSSRVLALMKLCWFQSTFIVCFQFSFLLFPFFFSLPPSALEFDIPVYATSTHSQDHHLHEVIVSNLLFLTFNFIILSICQVDPSSYPFLSSLSFPSHTHAASDPPSSNLYFKARGFTHR